MCNLKEKDDVIECVSVCPEIGNIEDKYFTRKKHHGRKLLIIIRDRDYLELINYYRKARNH